MEEDELAGIGLALGRRGHDVSTSMDAERSQRGWTHHTVAGKTFVGAADAVQMVLGKPPWARGKEEIPKVACLIDLRALELLGDTLDLRRWEDFPILHVGAPRQTDCAPGILGPSFRLAQTY
jgi:hypothetical protein